MKYLILVFVLAAFALPAEDLTVTVLPKWVIVNNSGTKGSAEVKETENDGKKMQTIRFSFLPEENGKDFRGEVILRPPVNAEKFNTLAFTYQSNVPLTAYDAAFNLTDSFWKTSYADSIVSIAKVKTLEAGKAYPCQANISMQFGKPARLNRASIGRIIFPLRMKNLPKGKEVVIEISGLKFIDVK